MDFLPKTANLQGGDTHKTPKKTRNLPNHGKPPEEKTPPTISPPNLWPMYHAKPFQSFPTKIPYVILTLKVIRIAPFTEYSWEVEIVST
jgi:hypothetical protein